MEDEVKNLSPFSIFESVQETYEDAVKKSAEESNSRMKRFTMDSAGTYSVRILPIAPVEKDGQWTLDRKGYEYPIKSLVLKIENPNGEQGDKKNKGIFVNVCHTKYVGLSVDLLDTYLEMAESKYGSDEKLMKKIKANSFEGGLKWNSQRVMYVIDNNKRGEGIQMLSLSYSQYKELEERKLAVWKKLLDKNPKAACPISSINEAYPVEIIRKEENKKISYAFNIDVLSGADTLTEEEVQALLNTQRIPENIYRYTNFHLEATIEFLKQFDKKMEMDVMSTKEIKDAIAKIKLELPSDDKSHFSFSQKGEDGDAEESEVTIDSLWDQLDDLKERGINDKSEEGQELREAIRNFINDNDLNVRIVRGKTNEDLLNAIEDALENETAGTAGKTEEDEEPQPTPEAEPEPAEDPEPEDEPEEEDEEEAASAPAPERHRRGEHNDDTNEPAVAPHRERRTARPVRRQR